MKRNILFYICIMLVLATASIGCTKQNESKKSTSNSTPMPTLTESQKTQPSASPMPFAEMTIPYLREHEYKSSLSSLEKESEHTAYTSYKTSYTSEGLKINAQLTIPKGDKPTGGWPAVVFVHGYIPPTLYKTFEKYIAYVDSIARNGFVVHKIDLRGHGSSEGDPSGAYYSSDYVMDTLNAYAALQSADFVNPNAIGLWGHSMAGNVVLRSLASKPDIPAAVIWAGAGYTYTDLQEFRIQDNSYRPPPNNTQIQKRRQELFNMYGQFNAENEFWKQVVPTNYIKDYKGALNIHHADDDNVVSIKYSKNLVNILDQTSIPHQLYEYKSGGHNITNPSFSTAMQRTVDFYKQYLK